MRRQLRQPERGAARNGRSARDPALRRRMTSPPARGSPRSPEQAHYLLDVMRLARATSCSLFNGRDGEWRAARGRRPAEARLRALVLERYARAAGDRPATSSWSSRWSSARGWRPSSKRRPSLARGACGWRSPSAPTPSAPTSTRLAAIAVEAAEQTGRLDVPEIVAPREPRTVCSPAGRPSGRLMFCDEAGEAPPALEALGRPGTAVLGDADRA